MSAAPMETIILETGPTTPLDTNQAIVDRVCYLVYQRVKSWDSSHDYQHASRVTKTIMTSCSELRPTVEGVSDEDVSLVAVVAGLAHDLIDPKYVADCDSAATQLRSELLECGMANELIDGVLLVIQNMSYSKEKRFGVDYAKLGRWGEIRDIVSDADKIDALGQIGIHRCEEFARKLHADRFTRENDDRGDCFTRENGEQSDRGISSELDADTLRKEVVKHCHEKLLHLLPEYIRTEPGKRLAAPLHQEIVTWVTINGSL